MGNWPGCWRTTQISVAHQAVSDGIWKSANELLAGLPSDTYAPQTPSARLARARPHPSTRWRATHAAAGVGMASGSHELPRPCQECSLEGVSSGRQWPPPTLTPTARVEMSRPDNPGAIIIPSAPHTSSNDGSVSANFSQAQARSVVSFGQ